MFLRIRGVKNKERLPPSDTLAFLVDADWLITSGSGCQVMAVVPVEAFAFTLEPVLHKILRVDTTKHTLCPTWAFTSELFAPFPS